VLHGLLVGALVTAGFLGFIALVGLPISYGVGAIARAVPWAGLATGAALAIAGLLTLIGRQLRLPDAVESATAARATTWRDAPVRDRLWRRLTRALG